MSSWGRNEQVNLKRNHIFFKSLFKEKMLDISKVIMKGKSIAVTYSLRTCWNQFSLGGICKQEYMQQWSFSILGRLKHWILKILIIDIIVSYEQNISLIFYVKDESHVRLRQPSFVYITAQTVHCSTKDAYTSEINFLAL